MRLGLQRALASQVNRACGLAYNELYSPKSAGCVAWPTTKACGLAYNEL